MDRAEGVLLVAELALNTAKKAHDRLNEIPSAQIHTSFVINSQGELVIVYNDGSNYVVGEVKGKDGIDGKDASNLLEGKINEKGDLTLILDNGKIINIGNIKGEKGQDGLSISGPPGRSITSGKINKDGYLILSFTDGLEENVGLVVGPIGLQGVGVNDIKINSLQELEISLTNEKTYNLGKIKGERGEIGPPGRQGIGQIGPKGEDGKSIKGDKGDKGDSIIGPRGSKGLKGDPGENGKDLDNIVELGNIYSLGIKSDDLSRIKVREMIINGEITKILVLDI